MPSKCLSFHSVVLKIKLKVRAKTICITDRSQAIRAAVMMAQPGDVILIAGKGHEPYQDVQGVKHHFDDHEEVRKAFGIA